MKHQAIRDDLRDDLRDILAEFMTSKAWKLADDFGLSTLEKLIDQRIPGLLDEFKQRASKVNLNRDTVWEHGRSRSDEAGSSEVDDPSFYECLKNVWNKTHPQQAQYTKQERELFIRWACILAI